IVLPDFPLRDLTIDHSAAESASGGFDVAAYRAALVAAGSDRLYERWTEVLTAQETSAALSADRLIEVFADNLTRARHSEAHSALLLMLGVVALLALLLLLAARRSRLLALGLSLALGGGLALAFTVVARGVLTTLGAP